MSEIRIRAADAASALNEVARRFGADALILSTTQQEGFVEVSVVTNREWQPVPLHPAHKTRSAGLPELPARLVLVGPPGAGASMLAARLAALHLGRASKGVPQLVAPRPDILSPASPLTAHARLLGLAISAPVWSELAHVACDLPDNEDPQIIDLSGMGGKAANMAKPLLDRQGSVCWLVIPTGLHLLAQDRLFAELRGLANAIALTRADLCPPTLEDRSLPQRFGLPIAILSHGTGLMEALRAPETLISKDATRYQKEVPHVTARVS